MNASQLINQDSGNVEIYTPSSIIEAARITLGGVIDLDPASSEIANRVVRARKFYSKEYDGPKLVCDGLKLIWYADTVWMNHPFSKKGNPLWINKLIQHYKARDVKSACCITFASTSEKWFQPLMDFPQCFLSPRTNYIRPDGSLYRGATKGSVVTYMGSDVDRFRSAFAAFGKVKV